MPTAMSFIVDKNGDVHSGVYNISNKSSESIGVYVHSFRDNNTTGGITVKPLAEDLLDRSTLHLTLHGNLNNKIDLANIDKNKNQVLELKPLESSTIQLIGQSGEGNNTKIDNEGTTDKFSLVLKIKKI